MRKLIQSPISRRSFIYRAAGLALTLWAGRSLAQPLPARMQLDISFEIVNPGGGRFKPPYVAAWIENASGLPVRTLAVWFNQSRKGWRYLDELRRFIRFGNPAPTVSGPTRLPGRYTLVWDGRDDKGNPLPQGSYFVCLETAREDGPYVLMREPIDLATSPFNKVFYPGKDLKEVTLAYH